MRLRRALALVCFLLVAISTTLLVVWSRFMWSEPVWRDFAVVRNKLDELAQTTSNQTLSLPTGQQLIPRIIHQTWKDENVPMRWRHAHNACRLTYSKPEWTHKLWTDADARNFISEHFAWFLPTYDSYPYPIQRVDAVRYFILYKYGGVYLDLDIGCRRSIEPLLAFPAVVPKTIPIGFSNDFMMAMPGHPFFKRLTESLSSWNHWYGLPYATVFFSTGPMFLNVQLGLYLDDRRQQSPAEPLSSNATVWVLDPTLYSGSATDRFFSHYDGSSWHEADVVVVMGLWGLLARPWLLILVVMLLSAFCALCCSSRLRRRIRMRLSNSAQYNPV